jgi:predicted metal-dependent hydrolase
MRAVAGAIDIFTGSEPRSITPGARRNPVDPYRSAPSQHATSRWVSRCADQEQIVSVDASTDEEFRRRRFRYRLRGAFIEVTVCEREPSAVRRALDEWYEQRARELLRARLDVLSADLQWVHAPPPIRLRWMQRQWGSCSAAGRITLHPALVQAPRECVDYVLLREFCHLASHDHSRKFYRLLDRHMPTWRAVKERLDGMAEALLRR